MADLYWGAAIVLVVSAAVGGMGYAIARRVSQWAVLAIVAAALVAVTVIRSDPDALWLARILPVSNLIVLGNPTLPAAALVSGLLLGKSGGRCWRTGLLLAPLLLLAGYDLFRPMTGHMPMLGDRWTDGVCRQTSEESCSAAAAATLLSTAGIHASEAEMARLCLTGADGTLAAGVYRGLKIKSAGRGLFPQPIHGTIDDLRKIGGPVLITVELRRGEKVDPRYQSQWGWTPGVAHSVVLFRFLTDGRIDIGDPDVGRETWNVEALRVLWHGDGIRLR